MTIRIAFAALGTTALLLTSGAATAQSARFSDIDLNNDGALSYEELESRFGAAAADRIWSRNDGQSLSRADVRRLSDDDDDDGGRDDDDDDGGRDDDDDDGGRDDDDDDGGRDDDDDDGGRSGGGSDDDDDGDDDDDD
ncbi:hypothetical protein [Rhodovulum sp. 12E13]|uniref:hypothetical protein n=1 Tax=Rhodovulum sp. 12E13 TaxID=2203891 RepID=UPI0018F2ADD7|nr:hypothetical protein [Rhodovulum sp. 12E13]